jgi:hypothetical protein
MYIILDLVSTVSTVYPTVWKKNHEYRCAVFGHVFDTQYIFRIGAFYDIIINYLRYIG